MGEAPAKSVQPEPIHILVLDDEESIRWVIGKTLNQPRYKLHFAGSAEQAARLVEQHPIDFALVDINLPGDDGFSFLTRERQRHPELLMAIMTGEGTMNNAVTAMKLGAFDYVTKPFDIDEVEALVSRAAQAIVLRRRHRGDAATLAPGGPAEDVIIGKSRSVREIYKAIGRVAATELTVLILGESGTGKELIARSIHQHSRHGEHPFIAVNCAAIPRDLLEVELFGHEKGAFTGAGDRRAGKFEGAGKGTVFLDEIGDMSLDLQAKMLRVLQEREFQRVGGLETLRLEARIVAATNQSIRESTAAGAFREDLYYRLSAFTIVSEPLRERRADIPLLVEHFLRKGTRELGLPARAITREAMARLTEYGWPGNVRELENTVKSLMILTGAPVIDVGDLPRNVLGQPGEPGAESAEQALGRLFAPQIEDYCEHGRTGLLQAVHAQVERPLIRKVMLKTGWNQVQAATILGINRNTLRTRLHALGLAKEGGRDGGD
ncbi:MAG: sigma-54-dependent Fis family transcriptional regulator [Candidatus Lambdaproteobacteria bacterium]|nr:sigma-54-dependent Fis family transcriptional regulator [Candidatus Lambdaproteobacteria bacterium]